jgi:hypothetical protein
MEVSTAFVIVGAEPTCCVQQADLWVRVSGQCGRGGRILGGSRAAMVFNRL